MLENFSIKELENNFKRRNIDVMWFDAFSQIKEYLLEQIPNDAKVGIGNSITLKSIDISNSLRDRGNLVFDKAFASNQDEIRQIKRDSLLADYYISSSNAVSVDGKIVNIDHSGNRVAAITYGPDKVYIVVGKNKITKTYDEAVIRARKAAPLNARRAGYSPPCLSLGHCVDCSSQERVCFIISIIEGQYIKNRMALLIADEEEGF